jgi:uncharacterized protein (TIGR01777 family)
MQIGITGASGLIGRRVVDLALQRGHEVIAFSRNPARTIIPGCSMRPFPDFTSAPPHSPQAAPPPLAGPPEELPDFSGCEAVVHLAGENVLGLWTPAKKRRIRESRLRGTRLVARALRSLPCPPEVFLSSSAIGYYGDSGESELLESSPAGTGFLAETCQAWEQAASDAGTARTVLLRTGIVLDPKGGALAVMAPLFRLGLGGTIGLGSQWMSWIHAADLAGMILFALENTEINGPMNGTAPWPERNRDFSQKLSQRLQKPCLFTVPSWALAVLGDFSRELLDSKRVLPGVATAHGFPFRFPDLDLALQNLL